MSLKVVQASRFSGIVQVADPHLGADAAELTGQVTERALVVIRRHVAAERILDAELEHADCALDQLVVVQLVDVLLRQLAVGVTEGLERLAWRDARSAAPAGGRYSRRTKSVPTMAASASATTQAIGEARCRRLRQGAGPPARR